MNVLINFYLLGLIQSKSTSARMQKEQLKALETFCKETDNIIAVLTGLRSKLPLISNSFNTSYDILSLDFIENDKLIHIFNEQRYSIIALNEECSSLLNQVAQIERDNEDLRLALAQSQVNKQEKIAKDDQIATVSLSDYELLKDDYLKLHHLNQINFNKEKEFNALMKAYLEAKESLSFTQQSYDELREAYDNQCYELKERIERFIRENDTFKEQLKGISSQYSLIQYENKRMKSKENKMEQRHNTYRTRMKSIEKTNVVLRKRCKYLMLKYNQTKSESECLIEALKNHSEELEERNAQLTAENKTISRNACKCFIEGIEKEVVKFHYLPNANAIEVYHENEEIGQVPNRSSSIKRSHSNKGKTFLNNQLSNCSEKDRIFLLNSLRKSCQNKYEISLNQLWSSSCSSSEEKKISSGNQLYLISYSGDNEMIFTNTLGKVERKKADCIKEITPFNAYASLISDDNNEGYSHRTMTVCLQSSFTLKTQSRGNRIFSSQSQQSFGLRSTIDINEPLISYSENHFEVNPIEFHLKKSKSITIKDTHQKLKCAICLIF